MSDGVKVGSFRWLGNLGDQIVVKDVGFKPRFIFFWAPTSDIENGGTGATYFAFAGVDNAGAIQNAGLVSAGCQGYGSPCGKKWF